MSNTKTEIDFEKILKENKYFGFKEDIFKAMKAAIKVAVPIILAEAADKVKEDYGQSGMTGTGKKMYDLIINLANSKELNKKLGI